MIPVATDAVVVGGGPAGLAVSIALRRKGLDVVVVEGTGPGPIDKACGEGLMPGAVSALERLGIDLRSISHWPFRGIRFVDGPDLMVEARFPGEQGIGVRRTALHRLLAERAATDGVQVLWGLPVTGLTQSGIGFASGDRLAAKWVIGADGGFSSVRRWAGLDRGMRERVRYGFRKHYRVAPWSETVEVHWGDGCQIYVTPVSEEEVGIAVLSSDRGLRLDAALDRFATLRERLQDAREVSVERGGISATRRLPRVAAGNVALVGDASGGVDAVTGEGLSQAFQQTEALASAISTGALDFYQRAHSALQRRPATMSSLLLLLDRHRRLRDRVLATMAARPEVFAGMLAGHVGASGVGSMVKNLSLLGLGLLASPKGVNRRNAKDTVVDGFGVGARPGR